MVPRRAIETIATMSAVYYRLRVFGRLIAELEVESDGFEITIEPGDLEDEPEALKWGED
jgi:hypothetical protein